ncbi:unnamed protein product [Eruca vesicaria subsp. sativa]|uniref:Uncharacterized protein n=1 Tax=Eruca vesicaria subsp. sativa TaxID=29727 RepID=A0ABC8LRG6_ERUVS|nr:unnamed protein product [Eruca vesicaria subsp. sativa]
MASTAENEATVHTSPDNMTTSDCQQSMEDHVCDDVEMLPVLEASSPELPLPLIVEEALIRAEEEGDFLRTSLDASDAMFAVPFPDPASTLNIHGSSSAISHQGGVQGTSSSEQIPLRTASSVNRSDAVHENGVQSPNISLANNLTTGPNPPPRHLFNDPYDYELEKIRLEEEHLKKSFEEMTSQLMAELDRKMAEARSEYDRELQEFDAKVMEVEAHMGLVQTGSLLANAFISKCSERSASNDLAAVRAAMVSQHSTQQQQAVHMNSTPPPRVQASVHVSTSAPPRPSVEAPILNSSGPLPHLPRRSTTTQPSQQTVQAAHTHVNSTAPPPPSVTVVEPQTPNHLRPLARFPRPTTTQPSPLSQRAVAQSNTNMNSTALPRPSVTTEAPLSRPSVTTEAPLPRPSVTTAAPLTRPSVTTEAPLPLHSPLSNTPRPRPRPVISNLTPSSTPPVRGPAPHLVRAPPPHMARRPAPHLRQYGSSPASMSAAAATTNPRASVQEQEKSNDGVVNLSDED